ncbi:hypothetical protein O7632_02730 [Solwaraspora sp. WMMD406]|uniref:hypothetical protein n=1 Tax=Solwaraspora sp. WMMD406 TaxID=3016095 RepID=UPI002416A61D|nr:hypothetical protein [Solwaraspora sp. WMMD406]MDG4763033.1 hypothetical protein [Solwaraspora sp. WMMD406]
MNIRPFFIRLGPSRWWYVAGLALWVAGFLGLFGYGYLAKTDRDVAAAAYTRVGVDGTLTVEVSDAGEYGVWLETVAGAQRPESVRRLADSRVARLVDIRVTGADGAAVPVGPALGYDYRAATESAQLLGWGIGGMALGPGVYQVTLVDPGPYADSSVAGLAVGPLSGEPDLRVLAGGLVGSAAGLGVCLVTLVRRQRATRRAAP